MRGTHRHSDEELHRGLLASSSAPANSVGRGQRRSAVSRLSRTGSPSILQGCGARLRRQLWPLALGLLGLLCLSYLAARRVPPALDYESLYQSLAASASADSGRDCTLPQMDPWDESIQKYLAQPPPLVCKHFQPELTSFNASSRILSLNASALAESGFGSVRCSYQCFRMAPGQDFNLAYDSWVTWESSAKVDCEFFQVSCTRASIPISVHANLYASLSPAPPASAAASDPSHPSVLILVIDSVSRSNAIRAFPKTLAFMKEQLHSVLFDGYAKIGDNSFPNAVAMLTGRRTCVAGLPDELPCENGQSHFDDWPLLWRDFAREGYATAFLEDYPNFQLFTYLAQGFRRRPADAYFRPFWVHAWPSFLHRRSTHLCLGARRKINIQLDYLAQVLEKWSDCRLFALDWQTEAGHDYLNQVRLADDDLVAFLRRVQPHLRNTVVILMADHGHRFDSIRESVLGRIEERMPVFDIALPPGLRKAHPRLQRALEANAKRLTTHFDLYVTLRDLLSGNYSREAEQADWSTVAPRGLSLLRPIPAGRGCAEAGMAEEFCVCQLEHPLNLSDPSLPGLAQLILDRVTEILSPVAELCAPLSLRRLRNAQTYLPNAAMVTGSKKSFLFGGSQPSGLFVHYRVAFEVAPSGAFLEGTLRQDASSGSLSVLGDVNRINRYGNDSVCVHNALQRKYCYCRSLLQDEPL